MEQPRDWIVVTSDKVLYSYVKTLGASVLRAHESPGKGEKPERETDVEGWLKKFGGGED